MICMKISQMNRKRTKIDWRNRKGIQMYKRYSTALVNKEM